MGDWLSTADEYGIPSGLAREEFFIELCNTLVTEPNQHGFYMYLVSVANEKINTYEEMKEWSIVGLNIEKIFIQGDPLSAIWGYTAADSVAIVALHYCPDVKQTDLLAESILLCTRLGDTLFYQKNETGDIDVRRHGELNDAELETSINILRRVLKLPVDTYQIRAIQVLVAWLVSKVGDATAYILDQNELPNIDSKKRSSIIQQLVETATVRYTAELIYDNPYYEKEQNIELTSILTDLLDNQNISIINDVEKLALVRNEGAKMANQVTWETIVTTCFAGLLPPELRSSSDIIWAGEGLSAWWFFHRAAPTVPFLLENLKNLNIGAYAVMLNWLEDLGWWPEPDVLMPI